MQVHLFPKGGAAYHKVHVCGSSLDWSVWVSADGRVTATEGYYWNRGRRATYGPARGSVLAEIVGMICRDYAVRTRETA